MCSSLTDQVRSIALVTTALTRGDLTQKIEIQVEGKMSTPKGAPEIPDIVTFISLPPALGMVNFMVDQLSAFASEVTRVALEVGTQGILGGQAKVQGVQGTWADLTRNVNVRIFLFCLSVSLSRSSCSNSPSPSRRKWPRT
jgi:osomolarity two-component system sensor histidine kinase NIK1